MGYTAKGSYFDAGVTDGDKALIRQYREQWAAADAAAKAAQTAGDADAYRAAESAKEQAHANAETVRRGYGYSGGRDGSDYVPLDDYRALIGAQNTLYRQQLEEQRTAQDAATQRAVNSLRAQRGDVEAQYADLFRQLYVDRMKNEKNLDQKLAAGGVTGGAAETTRLAYDTAYEDALRLGEQSRIGSLAAIDRAVTDAQRAGDIESANAAAKTAREQADAYADAVRYLIERRDAQRQAEEQQKKDAAKPTLTAAQVNAAIKSGILTDAVLAAYEYYYGAPYRG